MYKNIKSRLPKLGNGHKRNRQLKNWLNDRELKIKIGETASPFFLPRAPRPLHSQIDIDSIRLWIETYFNHVRASSEILYNPTLKQRSVLCNLTNCIFLFALCTALLDPDANHNVLTLQLSLSELVLPAHYRNNRALK